LAHWDGHAAAEAPAELLVLLDAHLLVAEEDHQVLHQRIVHLLELLVAQWPGEVDPGNLGADRGGELANANRLIGHVSSGHFSEIVPQRARHLTIGDMDLTVRAERLTPPAATEP
jgi:hypothetical protein